MWMDKILNLSLSLCAIFVLVQSDTPAFAPVYTVPVPPLAQTLVYTAPVPVVPPDAEPEDPVVTALAHSISYRLRNSKVLGPYVNFVIYEPRHTFFEVDTLFLGKAGFYDPRLTNLVADAVHEVGVVPSKLYFDAIAYTMSKFWFNKGIATADNVEFLAKSYANAVEVNACVNGAHDTRSVRLATTDGALDELAVGGFNDYNDWAYMFNLFATEVKRLAALHDILEEMPPAGFEPTTL